MEDKIEIDLKGIPSGEDGVYEVARRLIEYLSKKDSSKIGFTNLTYRGPENRAIYYTYPNMSNNSEPLNLAGNSDTVGTNSPTTAV